MRRGSNCKGNKRQCCPRPRHLRRACRMCRVALPSALLRARRTFLPPEDRATKVCVSDSGDTVAAIPFFFFYPVIYSVNKGLCAPSGTDYPSCQHFTKDIASWSQAYYLSCLSYCYSKIAFRTTPARSMGKPIPSTGAHTGSRQESTTPSTPSSYSNTTYGSRPSVDGIDDQTTPAIYSSPRVVDWSDVEDHDTGETPFPSHRALWAEIEAVINTPIVNLRVRDRTGRRLSLAFDIGLYRSYEAMLKGPLPKVGHTIVVLIARKFPARVEDLLFRLIPMALDDLMALGHRVRFHIPEQNGPRVCYGCGLLSKSLSRCNHCQMFWHCNKVRY